MTYDELKAEFDRRARQLKPLKKHDSAEINRQLSQVLAEIVSENVFDIENISEACEKILREYYEYINEINARLLKGVDKVNMLNIAPQKADFPTERVQQLADSLTDTTVPPETIQRRAKNAVANIANSFHDDFVRGNAEFRTKSGIKCYIVREVSGNCCAWCSSLAGKYVYGEEPADIFRRHDNCTCTVTFENGRERTDVWSKKKWQVSPVLKVPYKPLVMDRAQAENLQKTRLSQYQGLDKSAESGIIKSLDVDDFKLMATAGGRKIDMKAIDIIASTIKKYENTGAIYISDFYFGSLSAETGGRPLLQIEPVADRMLRINVNTDIFEGTTLEEINKMLSSTKANLAQNLEEAVVHECGHAKSLKGKTISQIKNFYDEISDAKIDGISEIAYLDGAEALAEIEVLRFRGANIPTEAMAFYNKYIKR